MDFVDNKNVCMANPFRREIGHANLLIERKERKEKYIKIREALFVGKVSRDESEGTDLA